MTEQNPQPQDTTQPVPADVDEQAISQLPVDTEERRKMAETLQELRYQGGDAEQDGE